ncbi:SMI1/KNR4 family protein [Sulfurovum sp.]|uniref:SMI1/KNR4 family protein n=1 Tax=Sulfurovum sp. TaxID=1969726 RepID=UPI0025F80E21|nr:SMI1/KNR4 family protein [Sulfurovum sp.]
MTTLEQLATKHNFSYPALYKALFKADKLNWMRGFEEPLPKGKTWAEDVYSTLKENPPLLLHSGGSDFELLTPDAILNFEFPEDWDTDTHHFIPFAKTAEGNTYAFYDNGAEETPIVLIWEDDEAEYVAKNFEDFIFRKMLEATDDIDKDNLYADYGKDNPIELYRTDLKADLESIHPYLKDTYISILETAYNGEVLETLIAYGFMGAKPVKEVIKEMLDFEMMGEFFEHNI